MIDQITRIFAETFKLAPSDVSDDLTPVDVRGWDSLGHLRLVNALEEGLMITFIDDDLIEMDSVQRIKAIVMKRASS